VARRADPIGLGREVYEDLRTDHPQRAAERAGICRTSALVRQVQLALAMFMLARYFSFMERKIEPSSRIYGDALRRTDPEIFDAIMAEEKRQRENIELMHRKISPAGR